MTTQKKRSVTRTCVICRQKFDKREVLRFVRTNTGVQVDLSGKMDGRGAYVCESVDCRDRLMQTDALAKALKHRLNDADREQIRRAVS